MSSRRARQRAWRGTLLVALFASLTAHVAVVALVPATACLPAARLDAPVHVDPPTVESIGVDVEYAGRAAWAPGGPVALDNVDDRLRRGGGGEAGETHPLFLVVDSAPITLVDAPFDSTERSQIQRIDTGPRRESSENRRATPSPSDDPFLASGDGSHRERRPVAAEDPREGASTATPSSAPSSPEGAERRADASPGVGIQAGRGDSESRAARVAHGRPSLDLGPAATVAAPSPRVADDTDSELLAAQLFEARVDASRRAASVRGDGSGGRGDELGRGAANGTGTGGRSAASSPGPGRFGGLDTGGHRYRRWLSDLRRRIDSTLVFPMARQLARDEGTSVVQVVVDRSGEATATPRVIRSSGFSDLDAAALDAVRRTLPFERLPPDVAPEQSTLTVTLPIQFSNPMVR